MRHEITPEPIWLAEAQALRDSGLTYPEIAKRLGKAQSVVWRRLNPERARELNVARRPQKREWQRKKAAERRLAMGIIEPDPCPGVLWITEKYGRVIAMTIVDLLDWEKYKDRRLTFAAGYAAWSEGGRTVYLHREILGLKHGANLKEQQSDHINRFKLDNRRANLRVVSAKENCANRGGVYEKAA